SFVPCAMNAILHTRNVRDAAMKLGYLNYLYKRRGPLEDLYYELNDDTSPGNWENLFLGQRHIKRLPDEDTRGVYYLTNGLPDILKESGTIVICRRKELDANDITDPFAEQNEMPAEEDGCCEFADTDEPTGETVPAAADECTAAWYELRDMCGLAETAPRYSLNMVSWPYDKLDLARDGNILCRVHYDHETEGLTVSNDDTFPYHLASRKHGITEVYSKEYIRSLAPEETPAEECMIAGISWCVADKEQNTGISRLEVFREEDAQLDLLLLLASAGFTMYELMHA
ncbi:MAG: hypothetical protein LUD51_04015, partial [Clostridia bacterium]|nr:hypothetical protein [Clostridia bacterium]